MSRTDTLRDLETEVGVLIRRVRRVIGDRARLVHPDLQPASYLILTTIAQGEPVRASAISELFDVDKGAVSRQVKHLVELGLLTHAKDPADARATLLSVTDEGHTRLADVVEHRQKQLGEKLSEWSDDELTSFVSELGRYNAALNAV
ncbi:MarR family winged helix-turn-helix transcriptional regulator [Nocardioides plantarum]|jgi:DNA-binding MarR family transcriptional regulator|uniref:MarR family winged helix-turn-helix transcriptional regulator n=1 Tax=Nocardioides plantarum TaxID=29299 RepID=A0ABV5K9C1_9ACTN|nr:MarR family transcriptional regulator [Nocardioides plantarum]